MKPATTLKLLAKVPREHLIALIDQERLDELLEQLADQFTFHPGGEPAAAHEPAPTSSETSTAPTADLTVDDIEPEEDELALVYGALLGDAAQTPQEIARFLGARTEQVYKALDELDKLGCVDLNDAGFWSKNPELTLAEARRKPRVTVEIADAQLGVAPEPTKPLPGPSARKTPAAGPSPESDAAAELARAYDALTSEPRPFAAILRVLGWSRPILTRALTRLEQLGVAVYVDDDGWKWHPVRTLSIARSEPLPGSADERTAASIELAFEALRPGEARLAADLAHELDWTWRLVTDVLGDLKNAGKVETKIRANKVYYERAAATEPKPEPKSGAQTEDAIFEVLADKRGPLSFDALARFAGVTVGPVAALMSRFLKEGYVTQGAGGVTITKSGLEAWDVIKAADEVATTPSTVTEDQVTAVLRALPGLAWNADGILGRIPTPVVMTLGMTLAKVISALGVLKKRGLAKENHAEGWFYTAAGIEAKNDLPEDEAWLEPRDIDLGAAAVTPAAILAQMKDGPKTVAQLASSFGVGVDVVRKPLEQLVKELAVDVIGKGRWTKYASAIAPAKEPDAKPKATRRKKGEQLVVPGA